jgi:hypothetical protein
MGDKLSLGNGFPTQDTTTGALRALGSLFNVCSEIACFFTAATTLA